MEKTFRAGIVGCGRIASDFADDPKMRGDIFTHAEAYSTCKDTILVAVCDKDPEQLARCGERWMVSSCYLDLQEMVRIESLDIISVATPDSTHYQVIKNILSIPNSSKVILCEKPLATSLKEAEEIVRLARENEVILAVMYMRRHAKNFQALKDFISSGRLGNIQAISGWYTKGIYHNGTHWFDALRFLAGEVAWLIAWNNLANDLEDPTLDVVLGLKSGCIASLRAADSKAFTIFEMDILGTKGRIRILDSGYQIEYSKVMNSKRYSGYKELGLSSASFGDRKNLMLHAVEDIVRTLKIGTAVQCSGEDGIEVLRIAEAAIESANSGLKVQIK